MPSKSPIAVVDGNNIAFIEQTEKGQAKLANILGVCEALTARGYRPIVIIDATLRYHIDESAQLEALLDEGTIHQAPAGTDADFFVLESAAREQALVVSNDQFEDYQADYPWIEQRRWPLMIINGMVELYDRSLLDDEET